MFFSFPSDAHWNPEHQAVEFGATMIGEYEGVVRMPRRVFQAVVDGAVAPERCLDSYHMNRTHFERVVERKIRNRQLTADGNAEITGRNLRAPTPHERAAQAREAHKKTS